MPEVILTYLPSYLIAYSMEQNPSCEANPFSAWQEILCILWNPKVHYRVCNSPLTLPFPNQINLVHTLTSHFLKIHLNIILPSTTGSSKLSLFPQVYPPKRRINLSYPHTCYLPCPSHSRFDHPNNI